jgi:hypothetical protein
MKLLVLCPGKIPKNTNEIRCFTDVINYYLPTALKEITDVTIISVPAEDNPKLADAFNNLNVEPYDAIITLGLRFYSKISKETFNILRKKFKGLICQTYDGSRFDYDPVDITFTFKNDLKRLEENASWYIRHIKFNEYIGWASDPDLNFPNQSNTDLRILVDHTNYGSNDIDKTTEVLKEIKKFVKSKKWNTKFNSVSVRRFDSGCVVDVDLSNLDYKKYDRSLTIPLSEISKEHSAAHIFCVTHPESVGLVVLETAMAGAFIVTPSGFISNDRLETVRHHEWIDNVNWDLVLDMIDIKASRKKALDNSWSNVALNIVSALNRRLTND